MPTLPDPDNREQAYLAESSAWSMLDGRIPGQAGHNPSLWAAWLKALRAASLLSKPGPVPPIDN